MSNEALFELSERQQTAKYVEFLKSEIHRRDRTIAELSYLREKCRWYESLGLPRATRKRIEAFRQLASPEKEQPQGQTVVDLLNDMFAPNENAQKA